MQSQLQNASTFLNSSVFATSYIISSNAVKILQKTAYQLLPFALALLCICFTYKQPASDLSHEPDDMAWLSSGSSNAGLIKNLASNGLITSERVKNAMLSVRL